MRILVLLLLLAGCVPCLAQSRDTSSEGLTVGFAFGTFFPFGGLRSEVEDPLQALPFPASRLSSTASGTWSFSPVAGIAMTLGADLIESGNPADENDNEALRRLYPDRLFISRTGHGSTMISAMTGPFYRFAWRPAALDLVLLGGMASHTLTGPTLFTKDSGGNRYFETTYIESDALSFVAGSAAIFRYQYDSDTGMMAQVMYTQAGFEHRQTIMERSLDGREQRTAIGRSYTHQALSLAFGMYIVLQ